MSLSPIIWKPWEFFLRMFVYQWLGVKLMVTLPNSKFAPENRSRPPKGNNRILTIHFQVRHVRFREGTGYSKWWFNSKSSWKMMGLEKYVLAFPFGGVIFQGKTRMWNFRVHEWFYPRKVNLNLGRGPRAPGCWLVTTRMTWNIFRIGNPNLNNLHFPRAITSSKGGHFLNRFTQ